ncbi:MAG: hypothetical protein HC808_15245 [Candidatus Competibacteraceae bacterium]|nr:hypothetical protein [Candidatus Competibacteraceae bacterium]
MRGLGGIFIWDLSGDARDDPSNQLVSLIFERLYRSNMRLSAISESSLINATLRETVTKFVDF